MATTGGLGCSIGAIDMPKNKVTPVRGLVARPQQQCVTDSLRDLHNVTEPAGKPLKMEGDLNISEKQ